MRGSVDAVFLIISCVQHDLRERDIDPVAVKHQLDFAVQGPFCLEIILILTGNLEFQDHGGIGEFFHTQVHELPDHIGDILLDNRFLPFDDFFELMQVHPVFDPDHNGGEGWIHREIDDIFNSAVVHDLDIAADQVADFCIPDSDFHNLAVPVVHRDHVAHFIGSLKYDEEA